MIAFARNWSEVSRCRENFSRLNNSAQVEIDGLLNLIELLRDIQEVAPSHWKARQAAIIEVRAWRKVGAML